MSHSVFPVVATFAAAPLSLSLILLDGRQSLAAAPVVRLAVVVTRREALVRGKEALPIATTVLLNIAGVLF